MPYEIVAFKKGYRVKVKHSGKMLSKKPLTLEQAKKQKIAVILNEFKRK